MVVSDTSPINYLVLIGQINVLSRLNGRVLIPQSVYGELGALPLASLIIDKALTLRLEVRVINTASLNGYNWLRGTARRLHARDPGSQVPRSALHLAGFLHC